MLTDPAKANLPRSERSGYLEEWTAGQGIKEVADFFAGRGHAVVGTEGFFGTLPDGLQMYLNDRPQITAIGVGINFNILPDSLVNSRKREPKLTWSLMMSVLKGMRRDLALSLSGRTRKHCVPTEAANLYFFFN